ncbi:MAG: protein-disulfide reductase DsbD domain-containing protein [Rikenellaceae bacterium]
MRNFFTLLLAIFVAQSLSAQVEWSSPMVEGLGGEKYRIHLTATLDEGWHMYDMELREGGPNATIFTFASTDGYRLIGDVQSSVAPVVKYDEMFAMEIGYYEDSVTFTQDIELTNGNSEVDFVVEWMLCNDMSCMPPTDQEFSVLVGVSSTLSVAVDQDFSRSSSSSIWLIILEAILWGFAALLTPCVFPMVPMTISFFMKDDGSKGRLAALLYGVFIVALYTLPIAAIILTTYLFGGDAVTTDIFNWVATHWLPNTLFFVIFMIFAASFFGAFEISLPSKWVNESDSRAGRGTIGGIFFLALTLVLVSFSCTGPIVGSVLIKSTSGEFWQPIVTMLAFSSAFALPFALVALFPVLMQRLPKSGGWLGSVKVVLGFLELALGLKFLSVADQTYHWGVLDREIYLALWIVIFSLLGFYLLGKIRFAHDSKVEHIGVGRLSLSIITFAFVVYMIPGMWGAPLKGLAGYLPPLKSQDFVVGAAVQSEVKELEYGDLQAAQSYANSVGKPLLVNLTGHGCVNCREMEQRVWSDLEVARILSEEYVVVELYMDDKRELPESQWVTTESGRVLKSVGRVNSYLALKRFGVNAQPYYILLGRDGEELTKPMGYNLNVVEYIDFLKRGIDRYKKEGI